MSWSLKISNGDLALSGTSLGQVTDFQKVVQDLRCALLESQGHDDMHPSFGSLIDGGIDNNGNQIISLIGNYNDEFTTNQIIREIKRVVAYYQDLQINRSQQDRRTYGESTLTSAEMVTDISDIQISQVQDKFIVNVTLKTTLGTTVLQVPIF